jgi:hypothetical protein
MAWVMPVMMAAGAIAGNENQNAAEAQRAQDQEMNAIETQYSNWVNPQYRQVGQAGSRIGSVLGGAASGAMAGSSMGQSIKDMGKTGSDFARQSSDFGTIKSGGGMNMGSAYGRPQGSRIGPMEQNRMFFK